VSAKLITHSSCRLVRSLKASAAMVEMPALYRVLHEKERKQERERESERGGNGQRDGQTGRE
jgi:hypothetical protein